jgi:hypothetical protein
MPPDLRIEPATQDDVPLILHLVKKLAEYERLLHEVVATEEDFRKALFGPDRVAEALLAFSGGKPVGFALYFSTLSTFVSGGYFRRAGAPGPRNRGGSPHPHRTDRVRPQLRASGVVGAHME